MQKQVQKLRILLFLGVAFFLTSCEKIPQNAKTPLLSQSGASIYSEPLSYINNIRSKSNLNTFTNNSILDTAALNHAKYVILNNEISHDEDRNKPYFTGITPIDRANSVGYNSAVLENLSFNAHDVKSSIDGLMSAIYHRFAFLNYEFDEIGIANFSDGKNNSYVYEIGNSKLENFCSSNSSDSGDGKFILGVCKNKQLRIKYEKYENFKNLALTPYVFYPNDEPTLAFFSNEVPDPMPECKIMANPISIEFNKNTNKIEMIDFEVFEDDKKLQNTKILTKKNDPNLRLNDKQFVLFSKDVFKFGKNYTAKFSYKQDNQNKEIKWNFSTQTPKYDYFIVKNGDSLSLSPDKFYDIFLEPDDCNDLIEKYELSYSFMNKPEVSNPFANTLRVKLSGEKNAKLQIKINNSKVINLYLNEKSKNYTNSLFYAFGGIIFAVIIFYFLARKRR